MPTYNIGRFGVSNDDVRVYSALPDVSSSQQILIGGAFPMTRVDPGSAL